MNWKKEGYETGQKICVILSFDSMYEKYSNYHAYEAEVIKAGTKKLKVKFNRDDKIETMEFTGQFKGGFLWGSYYSIWNNEQEYKDYKTEQYEVKKCQNTIKNKISLIRDKSTLDEIQKLMNSQLENKGE